MTTSKQRITVTVDPELITAGNQAVASGVADSMSGWVNQALTAKVEHDARLRALAEAIASYEAEFGQITSDEIAVQQRVDREAAIVVRSQPRRVRKQLTKPIGRGAA